MRKENKHPTRPSLAHVLWILVFCFLPVSTLSAQKPWVRISFGASHATGIQETLEAPPEYQPYVALGARGAFGWGESLTMEFGLFLTPHFSLSLGSGYAHYKLEGQKSPFPTQEYLDSEFTTGGEDFYIVVPGIELEVLPFFLNANYQIPLRGRFAANLLAGVAYYVGSLESKSEWDSYHMFLDRSVLILCDPNTLGFHFGGGFDVTLGKHLAFTTEALYRIAKFDNFTKCQVMDSHFPLSDPDGTLFPEFAYTIHEVDLTGISLQAGIKLLF
jgi:hypothetical protein